MIGRAGISHPSQRLSQGAVRIRRLPATHQIEFVAQPVEQVAFAAHKPDLVGRLAIADSDIEVTAQYKVGAAAKRGNTIENVMHRADVSTFTGGSVNNEH